MNSTGITRKLDELGRIVLPKELRSKFNLATNDAMEIFVEDDKIILKKYQPCCIFCGNIEINVLFNDKRVCKDCIEKLNGTI